MTEREIVEVMARASGFSRNRSRSIEYRSGYRAAVKDAITWLHKRAESMNDPHAKAILNTAAFSMGVEAKENADG